MRGATYEYVVDRLVARAGALALTGLLACSRASEPASSPSSAVDGPSRTQEPANSPTADDDPSRTQETAATPAGSRACASGERLDSGCVCRSGGACFDICCGENAECAHPATPGGPSACMLTQTPPPRPKRACKDGQSLSTGCHCDDPCMDICCVGSACTHRASPDGEGSAKCMSLPKR